jgi:glycosyltransferase involved in cell wall biosynthesis
MSEKALRIAQVSPLYESVPPRLYGGTERVVFHLSEELIAQGHQVTVFASGDSLTSGRLVPTGARSLRAEGCVEAVAPHTLMFERVRALADEFDIIHFHTEYMHFGMARSLRKPTVSTLHGRLDFPEYLDLFSEFRDLPLVAISDSQRRPLPYQNWLGAIHHGLCKDQFSFNSKSGSYLAFLGRISPEKGVEQAIQIAIATGLPLKIAAKIEKLDIDYYHSLQKLFKEPGIEFIGEISDREKSDFLGNAHALLFPITWPEPFGLVMIESLATGTPVVAFGNGSVPEVLRDGKTGYVVDSVAGAIDAVKKIANINRAACRSDFESRFTVQRMATDYVGIYREIISRFEQSELRFSNIDSLLELQSGVL